MPKNDDIIWISNFISEAAKPGITVSTEAYEPQDYFKISLLKFFKNYNKGLEELLDQIKKSRPSSHTHGR